MTRPTRDAITGFFAAGIFLVAAAFLVVLAIQLAAVATQDPRTTLYPKGTTTTLVYPRWAP